MFPFDRVQRKKRKKMHSSPGIRLGRGAGAKNTETTKGRNQSVNKKKQKQKNTTVTGLQQDDGRTDQVASGGSLCRVWGGSLPSEPSRFLLLGPLKINPLPSRDGPPRMTTEKRKRKKNPDEKARHTELNKTKKKTF